MGFLSSYLRQANPATWGDQRRRAYQKQQWRKRVDAQMRAPRQSGRTVACPNCSSQITFPLRPGTWTCTKCGYQMVVTFGKNTTTVRQAGTAPVRSGRVPSTASELERIARLHESGALTDAEFAAAKTKVIGGEASGMFDQGPQTEHRDSRGRIIFPDDPRIARMSRATHFAVCG